MTRALQAALAALALAPGAARAAATPDWCGTRLEGAAAALAAHRERAARPGPLRVATAADGVDFDTAGVAVLVNRSDLILEQVLFDLSGASLRLTPEPAGGWRIARVDAAPLPDTGNILDLDDDDIQGFGIPFDFPFYGTSYNVIYVNSDGNLTFDWGDAGTSPRDLGRLLEGRPRIAPLLADLDPSAGGRVTASMTPDRLVVTWTGVPQWGRSDANDFQVVLRPDGSIEMTWMRVAETISNGVVGVSPGVGASEFTPLDLSSVGAVTVPTDTFVESFRDAAALDVVAAARRFYATHPDDYDQLVVFSGRRLVPQGTLAYHVGISNQLAGVAMPYYDDTAEFGSDGRLQGVAMMDEVAKYPDDPTAVFYRENSALALLAHETGHRWLARVWFRDGERDSPELLGRQRVHWSFYLDTNGSYLEGNDIVETGEGRFETVGAAQGYSALDLYLMGVLPHHSVPPFFLVRNAGDGALDPGRPPETGVAFTGGRVDVTVDQVIDSVGLREHFTGAAPPWRQAFVYISDTPQPAPADLDRVSRLRDAWEPFFAGATAGLWSVDTSLP